MIKVKSAHHSYCELPSVASSRWICSRIIFPKLRYMERERYSKELGLIIIEDFRDKVVAVKRRSFAGRFEID